MVLGGKKHWLFNFFFFLQFFLISPPKCQRGLLRAKATWGCLPKDLQLNRSYHHAVSLDPFQSNNFLLPGKRGSCFRVYKSVFPLRDPEKPPCFFGSNFNSFSPCARFARSSPPYFLTRRLFSVNAVLRTRQCQRVCSLAPLTPEKAESSSAYPQGLPLAPSCFMHSAARSIAGA